MGKQKKWQNKKLIYSRKTSGRPWLVIRSCILWYFATALGQQQPWPVQCDRNYCTPKLFYTWCSLSVFVLQKKEKKMAHAYTASSPYPRHAVVVLETHNFINYFIFLRLFVVHLYSDCFDLFVFYPSLFFDIPIFSWISEKRKNFWNIFLSKTSSTSRAVSIIWDRDMSPSLQRWSLPARTSDSVQRV